MTLPERLASLLALAGSVACNPARTGDVCLIPDDDLGRVGVYVVHNLGCKLGCDQVDEGDVIQKIDGRTVETSKDFDAIDITDGIPHLLSLLEATSHVSKTVEIVEDGRLLPPIPMYRIAADAELAGAGELGMEATFSVLENLGRSPAIVLLDERGIVRWHSEGVVQAPSGAPVSDPGQYTIIEAVRLALERL